MGQPTNIECSTGTTIIKSEYWGRAAYVTDPLDYKAGWSGSGFTLFAIQSDPASVKCSHYYYENLKF